MDESLSLWERKQNQSNLIYSTTIESEISLDSQSNREELNRKNLSFEREMEKIKLLEKSLNSTQQLTDNMVKILDSFEDRLKELETSIYPIHKVTTKLRTVHQNIVNTLSSIDSVNSQIELHDKLGKKSKIMKKTNKSI